MRMLDEVTDPDDIARHLALARRRRLPNSCPCSPGWGCRVRCARPAFACPRAELGAFTTSGDFEQGFLLFLNPLSADGDLAHALLFDAGIGIVEPRGVDSTVPAASAPFSLTSELEANGRASDPRPVYRER